MANVGWHETLFHSISISASICRDVKTSRDTTTLNSRGRGRGARADRGTRGARGGSRGAAADASGSRNNVVASTGLFSEGAGDGASKRLMSRFRGSDNSESASTLRRPTINKKERVDPILEQKHIQEIYDLDDDPVEDPALANDHFTPINLTEGRPSTISTHHSLDTFTKTMFSISMQSRVS